ncbi:hypothetical protein [Thiocystis violascens]|uniref:Uncharacterized protein n=1 Tax=Thiocystis violascens (strain ATCC 17096 / DSM 198 / 6111) TaxID=765911 RepID=I3Y8D3_THIV6|nr:hypothetical protein [Thiocystis violascens]AFL73251.1 hypothetical protein Thivi_1228 [Thiocystis violascens DSM 198]
MIDEPRGRRIAHQIKLDGVDKLKFFREMLDAARRILEVRQVVEKLTE